MSRKKRPDRGADATGRSKYDGQHVRLHEWMLKSPAYRSLDCVARSLLIEVYRLYRPNRNGELQMGTRRAADLLNVSNGKAAKGFKDLAERGFIRPRQRGAFTWKARYATTWVLTEFGFGGHLPTKEFMHWRPSESVPLDVQIPPAENKNTVSPGVQTVHVAAQTVSPDVQMEATDRPSVPPRVQIPPESTPICTPGDTLTITRQEGAAGGSVKLPWRAPTYIEIPIEREPKSRRRPKRSAAA